MEWRKRESERTFEGWVVSPIGLSLRTGCMQEVERECNLILGADWTADSALRTRNPLQGYWRFALHHPLEQ